MPQQDAQLIKVRPPTPDEEPTLVSIRPASAVSASDIKKLPNLVQLDKNTVVDADYYSKRLSELLDKPDLATRAGKFVTDDITSFGRYVENFYDEMKERTKPEIDDFAAAHPLYHGANVFSQGVLFDAAKFAAGMVSDPRNLPFLLVGGPNAAAARQARPTLKALANMIFTGLQGSQAVQDIADGNWQSAAVNTGFALIGLRYLPSELKAALSDLARAHVAKSHTQDLSRQSRSAAATKVFDAAKAEEAAKRAAEAPTAAPTDLVEQPAAPEKPAAAVVPAEPPAEAQAVTPPVKVAQQAEQPPAPTVPAATTQPLAEGQVAGAAPTQSTALQLSAKATVEGRLVTSRELESAGGKWNNAKIHWEFPDGSSGYFNNLGIFQPTNAAGMIEPGKVAAAPPRAEQPKVTDMAKVAVAEAAAAKPTNVAQPTESAKWVRVADSINVGDTIRRHLRDGLTPEQVAAAMADELSYINPSDRLAMINAVATSPRPQLPETGEGTFNIGFSPVQAIRAARQLLIDATRYAKESITGRPSPSTFAELRARGINVIEPARDLGFIARWLGSVTQQLRKISLEAGAAADILADSSNAMAKNTFESLKVFKEVLNDNYYQWGQLVTALADPSITPQKRPAGYSDHVWDGYLKLRGLLDHHRLTAIENRRESDIANGYTAEQAIKRTPDDWGKGVGYYPHVFTGNWSIYTVEAGPKGDILRPVDVGWKQRTLQEALDAAELYQQQHPGSDLHIELDQFSLPAGRTSDAAKLRNLTNDIKEAATIFANEQLANLKQGEGVTPSKTAALVKEVRDAAALGGAMAYGPGTKRITPRKFGHAMQRESNLPGWMMSPEGFEIYIRGMERYLELVKARPRLLQLRNYLAAQRDIPAAKSVAELPKLHNSRLIARLDGAIEALEGYPTRFMSEMRGMLERSGKNPELADKAMGLIVDTQALLKLGYSPISALANLSQTLLNTYPVLGEKYTSIGIKGYADLLVNGSNSKYYPIVHELGVEAQVSKLDIDTFHDMRLELSLAYKQSGNAVTGLAKAAYAGLRDLGLFMFGSAESANRNIAAIGAYERARNGWGLPHDQAIAYARDVVNRTQFVFHRFDRPAVLAALPAPISQFKTFTLKQMEFVTGLRGVEIVRFLAALTATGVATFPALKSLDSIVKFITSTASDDGKGYSFLDEWAKDENKLRLSRGLPGYVDYLPVVGERGPWRPDFLGNTGIPPVDITRNVGFADWLSGDMTDPQRLAGPAASDAFNALAAGYYSATGASRKGEDARTRFLRGLSPQLRRTVEALSRQQGPKGGILLDPRTQNVIVDDLSTGEQLAMGVLGATPLRVAQEQELNRIRGELVARHADVRGFYIDRLAEIIVATQQAKDPLDRKRLDSLFAVTMDAAGRDGVLDPSMAKAVQERVKRMGVSRDIRDLMDAPRLLRPDIIDLNKGVMRPAPRQPQPQPQPPRR